MSSMLACRVCKARAPRRRDVSPFASRDNELLCPVGSLLFGSRDVAIEIRDTPPFPQLSFEAGEKRGIVDRILHARHPNFLFFLLDTPSTRNGSSRKSNARYDTVFSFIFHRSQLDRAEKMGSGTKFEFELEISKSCFLDFTISRVFRSLEVEVAVWI